MSRSCTCTVSRSAMVLAVPCISATRKTNVSPCAYGREMKTSAPSASNVMARRKERIKAHVTLADGIRDSRPGIESRNPMSESRLRKLVIAIDGPSGAGKGTVARAIAGALGYQHLDSGAMYRAVGWKALHDQLPLDDEEAIARLADRADIDKAATAVARLPHVRAVLVARQRALGSAGGIVMEGRDIGTVVFPMADVKVYLDAAPAERARRRANDPAHTGVPSAVADVQSMLSQRDEQDRTRTASPLYAAPDAIVIDTTGKNIDEVVRGVMAVIGEKVKS